MKKKLLLSILPLLTIGMMTGCAEETETQTDENGDEVIVVNKDSSEGLVYQYNADKSEYTVTNYIGNATGVIIPDEYNGKKVTAIGDHAFKNNLVMKKIIISGNVRDIGRYAFSRTYNLDSIEVAWWSEYFMVEDGIVYNKAKDTIYCGVAHRYDHFVVPTSIKTLRDGCFGNFENLTFLDFSLTQFDQVKYSSFNRFAKLFNAEEFNNAKYSVDKMKNHYVPNIQNVNVRNDGVDTNWSFPSNFFYNCKTLTNVKIDSTTCKWLFSNYSFYNCVSLQKLDFRACADILEDNYDYCFYNCISLRAMYFGTNTRYSEYRSMFNYCSTSMIIFFAQKSLDSKYINAYRDVGNSKNCYSLMEQTYDDYDSYYSAVPKIDLSQYDDFTPAS